ncbi:MAG TPA: dolichyl-phosphate beta-glucosyltransferase [Thermoplasmata archaeon]|nr:dolichyl-phosphate beta-glucosyltransferase [Thermoplasmata archaeon]
MSLLVKGVSVVIPAWNEEHRLGATLGEYLPALESLGRPFEVIVVTDGSTDGTTRVARSFESRGVRLLEFPTRLGKGGATIRGLLQARYEDVGFVDADGSLAVEDLVSIIARLGDADGVIASRWMAGSKVPGRLPAVRRFASRSWNLMVRLLLALPYHDTQCGAKFFRSYALQDVLHRVEVMNWAFDVAILFHLRRAGFSIIEVPVTWRHDDRSKLPLVETMADMFVSLLAMRIMNLPFAHRFPRRVMDWVVEQAQQV